MAFPCPTFLPYDALAPHMSRMTLEFPSRKHTNYVTAANNLAKYDGKTRRGRWKARSKNNPSSIMPAAL